MRKAIFMLALLCIPVQCQSQSAPVEPAPVSPVAAYYIDSGYDWRHGIRGLLDYDSKNEREQRFSIHTKMNYDGSIFPADITIDYLANVLEYTASEGFVSTPAAIDDQDMLRGMYGDLIQRYFDDYDSRGQAWVDKEAGADEVEWRNGRLGNLTWKIMLYTGADYAPCEDIDLPDCGPNGWQVSHHRIMSKIIFNGLYEYGGYRRITRSDGVHVNGGPGIIYKVWLEGEGDEARVFVVVSDVGVCGTRSEFCGVGILAFDYTSLLREPD